MKKPNFEKVSVSIPPEVHEWLKAEAKRRTTEYGESWSASRIVQESIREYRSGLQNSVQKSSSKASNVSPDVDAKMVRPYKRSVGGSSTATTARSRKTG